jgi:hypothetical protein
VRRKDGCETRGLPQGRTTLKPGLAAVSEVVAPQFSRITASACCKHCLFVDVDGLPYLSASTTLVRPRLNISIYSHTLHRGTQFNPQSTAKCRCICASFVPPDTKNALLHCCLSPVQTSGAAVIFTPSLPAQLNHEENFPILPLFLLIHL